MPVKYEYAVTLDVRGVACEPRAPEFYFQAQALKSLRAQPLPATLWRRERYTGGWEIVKRRTPSPQK